MFDLQKDNKQTGSPYDVESIQVVHVGGYTFLHYAICVKGGQQTFGLAPQIYKDKNIAGEKGLT